MSISTVLRGLRAGLRKMSHDHPLLSNAVMYGGLYTLAEVSQQKIRARTAVNNHVISGNNSQLTPKMSTQLITKEINELGMAKTAAGSSNLLASPSHHAGRLDMSSVKRYAIMGTLIIPPILTKWYHWLDNK